MNLTGESEKCSDVSRFCKNVLVRLNQNYFSGMIAVAETNTRHSEMIAQKICRMSVGQGSKNEVAW